jgi:hypothetical protein
LKPVQWWRSGLQAVAAIMESLIQVFVITDQMDAF